MRPGAAVRLKGTWKNDNKASSRSSSLEASDEIELAINALATPELQVTEVEILGSSDPQV